jgi:hypothetical protein
MRGRRFASSPYRSRWSDRIYGQERAAAPLIQPLLAANVALPGGWIRHLKVEGDD